MYLQNHENFHLNNRRMKDSYTGLTAKVCKKQCTSYLDVCIVQICQVGRGIGEQSGCRLNANNGGIPYQELGSQSLSTWHLKCSQLGGEW